MSRPRKRTLKIPLTTGSVLRTADDVAYAWKRYGRHRGWTRTSRPDQHDQDVRLLIPRMYDRTLAAAVLDLTPDALKGIDLGGVVLILPDCHDAEPIQQLLTLRKMRMTGKALEPNDVTLARATNPEVLQLADTHGDQVAARALELKSLPQREELTNALGHDRVAAILSNHDGFPEEATWQIMRSSGFTPEDQHMQEELLPGLAGNPNLTADQQLEMVKLLTVRAQPEQPNTAALERAARCPTLPEEAASWLLDNDLPHAVVKALAANTGAQWSWLRQRLDSHPNPEVALASLRVGSRSETRCTILARHPDPVVRSEAGNTLPAARWDWETPAHCTILTAVDDPFSYVQWSNQPSWVEPEQWGAYAVARQWAARAEEHPEAESHLRQMVNLHNRSWGAIGRGHGDPQRAARADADKVLARTEPGLVKLGLTPGESYEIEEARMIAVQVVAGMDPAHLRNTESDIVAAVLDACAAESLECHQF